MSSKVTVLLVTVITGVVAQYVSLGHKYDTIGHYYYSYPQPYNYGYNVEDVAGNHQYKTETGDNIGGVKGSYGYTDASGIHRQVDYVADRHGFRAHVRTNEPGTASQNPASVGVQSVAAPPSIPHYKHHYSRALPYHRERYFHYK